MLLARVRVGPCSQGPGSKSFTCILCDCCGSTAELWKVWQLY
jgi:hypothetical protein